MRIGARSGAALALALIATGLAFAGKPPPAPIASRPSWEIGQLAYYGAKLPARPTLVAFRSCFNGVFDATLENLQEYRSYGGNLAPRAASAESPEPEIILGEKDVRFVQRLDARASAADQQLRQKLYDALVALGGAEQRAAIDAFRARSLIYCAGERVQGGGGGMIWYHLPDDIGSSLPVPRTDKPEDDAQRRRLAPLVSVRADERAAA